MRVARAAVISGGLIRARNSKPVGDIYLVSDDPLDSSREIVTIDVPEPTTKGAPPGTSHTNAEIPYVAVVNRGTSKVSAVGRAPTG